MCGGMQKLHLKWGKPPLNPQKEEKYDKDRKIFARKKFFFRKNMSRAPGDSEGGEMAEWARASARETGATGLQEGNHG